MDANIEPRDNSRILVFGTAPQPVVEQFLEDMAENVPWHLWINRQMEPRGLARAASVLRLDSPVHRGDGAQKAAYLRLAPTDVVIVCGARYWHDNVVEAVLAWSRALGPRPRFHVFEHGILFDGYLKTARQHPAFTREG